ncbi:MAG TPA: hypothetical protein VJP86_05715, partial [Vicinamibacterales bacterium]|nr:hypothetical protein [Vicinamibacterales bacterium]
LARPVSASKDSPTIKPAIAYPDSRTERQNPCSSSVRVTRIQWIANCYGSAYANVQTWDPAGFVFDAGVLNETWSYADWIRSDGWITSLNPVGNCWADDETFLYTHWFVTGCSGLQYNGGWSFSYSKYGEYFNEDFVPLVSGGELEGAVLISHRATVGSDGPNEPFIDYEYTENSYSAGWFALGLITGHFSGDTAEANNCWFVCSPSESDVHDCEYEMLGYWNYDLCECSHGYDPLIIDMADDGFAFTDANNGVTFDLRADGHPIQTAWTQPGSTDAFLVLDRNGNGTVDDGSELFSDVSPQNAAGANVKLKKKSSGPNGFGALSVFDTVAAGGNADGQISSDDSVFGALRLWTDENHNGVSEAPELKSLDSQGVRAISLKYSASKQNDQYGNHVAYRSRAIMDRDMVSARGTSLRVANVFFLGH